MNPTRSRRSSVSLSSFRSFSTTPSRVTEPDVGRSSPASRCISVDLPDPDGPMIAAKRFAGKSRLTPTSASTAASPSPKRRCRSRTETIGWALMHPPWSERYGEGGSSLTGVVGHGAVHQRLGGACRVKPPRDDLVEQALELGILAELLFQAPAQPRSGQRQDLVAQVAPAPLLQVPLTGDVVAMLVELAHQLVDPLAARRLSLDDRHPPPPLRGKREHAADLAHHGVGERVVGLVDDEHVRDLHHAGL